MITFICGIRGMGKTRLTRQVIHSEPRVLAYDPYGEHDMVRFEDPVLLVAYLDRYAPLGRFRVSLANWRAEDLERDSNYFCAVCWATARVTHDCLAVFEEVDTIAPPGREPSYFRRIIAQGRHAGGAGYHGVSILATARRPAEVSRLLTSQAERIFTFRIQEPTDLQYFRSIMGKDTTDHIPTLRPGQYLAWTPTGCTLHMLVGQKETIDGGRQHADTQGVRFSPVPAESGPPDSAEDERKDEDDDS